MFTTFQVHLCDELDGDVMSIAIVFRDIHAPVIVVESL